MTNKTTMPEPVAWLLACQTYAGDTAWSLSWTQSGAGTCHRLSGEEYEKPLITTTQAEAYADARVREALEAAAKICDDRAMKNEAAVSADEPDEASSLRAAAWQMGVCARDIRALIPTTKAADYAVAKARGAQQWQPIETAPKSGRSILLGFVNSHGNWRTMLGRWISKEEILNEWEDGDLFDEGWYEISVEADDVPNCWLTNPSHWMPLPPPPTK